MNGRAPKPIVMAALQVVLAWPILAPMQQGAQSPLPPEFDVHPGILGRHRSEFGDPFSWLEAPKRSHGYDWVCNLMADNMPTKMLFPAGSSLKRYYFNHRIGAPTGSLVLESKRGRDVVQEWWCEVRPLSGGVVKDPTLLGSMGTLEAYLARQGFGAEDRKDPRIRGSLKRVTGLALYEYIPATGLFIPEYVAQDGSIVTWLSNSVALGEGSVPLRHTFPRTDFDYPITSCELLDLKRLSNADRTGLQLAGRARANHKFHPADAAVEARKSAFDPNGNRQTVSDPRGPRSCAVPGARPTSALSPLAPPRGARGEDGQAKDRLTQDSTSGPHAQLYNGSVACSARSYDLANRVVTMVAGTAPTTYSYESRGILTLVR
jgi:hypothetical protein